MRRFRGQKVAYTEHYNDGEKMKFRLPILFKPKRKEVLSITYIANSTSPVVSDDGGPTEKDIFIEAVGANRGSALF